jgi:type I restriction enzyme S subunit
MDDKMNIKTSGLKCDKTAWKGVRLGEVGDFFKGHGVTMKDTCVTGVPCTMYGDIYVKYGITFEQVDYYLPAEKAEKAFKGQYGDLLFTASGETAKEIGKCAGYFGNKEICIGGDIIVLRPYECYDSLFLSHLCNSPECIRQKAAMGQGDAVVHIKTDNIQNISLSLPESKEEQKRIASALSSIDTQITTTQKLLSKYESIKKATVNLLLKPKADWICIKLVDIGNVAMCKRILKSQTAVFGEVPFYKIGTFGKSPDAFISRALFEDYKQRFSYPKVGDVLLSAAGTIGRTVVFNGEDAYFQDSNIVWLDNNESIVSNRYLNVIYSQLKWQTENGGTVSRLYNANILNTTVVIPHLEEQKRIVASLDSIDHAITGLKEQLNKSQKLKQSMLQYFFGD